MAASTYAVLLADVMRSSALRDLRGFLGKQLAIASRDHLRRKLIRLPYSVTAGDEFQTVSGSLRSIPAIILDLRRTLQPLSLRIGIGIGRIAERIQPPVNRLGGEAFQFARNAIEGIMTNARFKFDVLTAFDSSDEGFNSTINLIYGLHDTLVLKITPKQWETIEVFAERSALGHAARRLRLDASTVSRNLKRGYYWQLSKTVEVAGSLIDHTFP